MHDSCTATQIHLNDVIDGFSILTWNCTALFGSMYGNHAVQSKRLSHIRGMVDQFTVNFFQECHGTREDSLVFGGTLHEGCRLFFSAHASSAAGGVMISIGVDAAAKFPHWHDTEIVPGRALLVRGTGNAQLRNVSFVCVHLEPALNREQRKDFLRKVRRCIPENDDVYLGGDFNFLALGDKKHMIKQGTMLSECASIATYFQEQFQDFTELYQPEPTRRAMRNNTVYSASRLDRIYTNVHHILLDMYDISVMTLWPACAHEPSSDHVPVGATIKARGKTSQSRCNIPSWVTRLQLMFHNYRTWWRAGQYWAIHAQLS